MSKVAIVGDPSGTGTFTISAPNGNTDRTLVLPDEAGTVLTTAGVPASAMPAGSVLQVVSSVITTSYYRTSASTTYLATGISISITPTKASSKILVWFTGGDYDNLANGRQVYLTIFRGAVNLGAGAAQSLADIYSDVRVIANMSVSYLDTPNTTSSVTYELYAKNAQGACMVNNQSSALTAYAMEIAQ